MADNQRKYPRHKVNVNVQLSFLAYEPTPARTRDISDGGMFLEIDNSSEYQIGEILHLRYRNPFRDNRDTMIDAIVVRITSDGLGITFPETTP